MPSPSATVDEWFGGYLQNQKVGYMHVESRPVTRDGRALIEYTTADHFALSVLGQPMEQTSGSVTLCDSAYRPIHADFTLRSAGRDMAVIADFHADRIECQRIAGATTTQRTVPIPPGANLVADERALLTRTELKPGAVITLHQFNPLTLALDTHTLTVVRSEPLALAGETIDTTVIEMQSPYLQALVWVDDQGRMQQLKVPLMQAELVFRRESKDQALAKAAATDEPRVDLVLATGIQPDRAIERPREVRRLDVEVKGLDSLKSVPTDAWQQLGESRDGWRTLTVTAQAPQPDRPPTHEELSPFLQPATYIESDAPEMLAAAKGIVSEAPAATDAHSKAERIHTYVNQHIRWQSNIGLFRSALEILNDPVGVCRDSAALYTALARAAGVPTRICAGLVYVNGKFLGHAWAEAWEGDRWVPYDATTASTFVDATHLKLSQGASYTALFEMLPALGNLEIRVTGVEHRAE